MTPLLRKQLLEQSKRLKKAGIANRYWYENNSLEGTVIKQL